MTTTTFSPTLGTAVIFLPLKFSLTIVYLAFAPIRAPRPEHFSARVARGLNEGALLPLFFVYYHMVKLLPTRTKG